MNRAALTRLRKMVEPCQTSAGTGVGDLIAELFKAIAKSPPFKGNAGAEVVDLQGAAGFPQDCTSC